MPKNALGTFEIAKRCHVTPTTVYRWIKDGKLRSFFTGGGHNRVLEDDLSELMKSLKILPDDEFLDGGPKMLIVEDNPVEKRLIARLLRTVFPKADIHEAVDGYDAGFKTRALKPSLVIMDIRLPGINGINVCRIIKRDKELKHTKILAITAYDIEKSRRVVLKAGADAFIGKPLDHEDFIEAIGKLTLEHVPYRLERKRRKRKELTFSK